MMLKKAGVLTVGVSAALLAASPMAFAGNATDDNGGNDHGGHSHHHGHGDHHKGSNNTECVSRSGDVAGNDTTGILALGPILDGNSGQLLSCNSFLNDNLNHNLNNLTVDVL